MATNKNFVIKNGLIVNGSEVITSAGNLTNIGTISSGAITGSSSISARNDYNISTQANAQLVLLDNTTSALNLRIGVDTDIGASGGASIQVTQSGVSNDRDLKLNPFGGKVSVGVSSANNLTSTFTVGGTISSGAISASTVGVTNIVTNKVVKFNGTILDDSNITDTGSLITLGSATTVSGAITSSLLVSTIVDPGNPSPATDELRVSGYGVIGNRGSMYLTNSNASGQIVMGISGAHNANPKLTVTTSGITVGGNVTVSGTVDGVDIAARNAILTSTTTTAGAALPKAGGTMTGALTGTTATFFGNAAAGTNALNILGSTNGNGTGITFSDNGTPGASATGQNGYLTYYHSDAASYGSGNAFILTSSEPTTTILADGKLMYKEGIYSKPSTGTGAGTRKDANWDTAYGWGNHASASYATQTYVGTQISNLVDSSPAALNTLNELAAAIGDDASFSTTVTNNIATKLPLAGGTITSGTNVGLKINHDTFGAGLQLYRNHSSNASSIRFENTSGRQGTLLGISSDNGLYWQIGTSTTSNKIFHDTYHPNADTLTTARTINGVSFNGSANITVADSTKLPLAGGTLTGTLATSGVIRQVVNNVGVPTAYGLFTMEATDAQLDLVSSSAGTWGSAINFVQGASTTANTNNWSIARKTSSGGNSLNFNFGIANQHDNTTRVSFSSTGEATFNGRTIMGGDGARVQVANSTAADTSNLYTLAVGSQSGNKSILAARDINTTAGGYQINGTTVIDADRNITAAAITSTVVNTGDATLLTLYHDTGVDTSQQKSFIDFSFQDDNTNETPQVRIGAEVGQNADANTQEKEGSGAFVVYTNNANTTAGAAGTSLAERMRVDYRGYVGINTTTPSSLLDVNGTVTFKAAGNGWADNLNLMSNDGTNKWNLLVDNGFADGLRFGYNQNARVEFSTAGVVTATGFTTPGSISGGFTRAYVAGNNNVQTIVAVLGSNSTRPVLQFSESTANTITAGMSLEYNGQGSGATNYMSINAVTGASIFKVYSGGNVQLTGSAKLLFNNSSNFGVGAGGHNYNSVYVDTLESGSANDMLELVYYQGSGVRIGQSGNEKPLICGAFTSEAITTDGNFVMTKDQPWVVIENTSEDGGGIVFNDNQAGAWPNASSQAFRMTYHSGNNSFVMGHDENSYAGFSFASGGNFTASGNVTAYSDERLKENIQTLDGKKALQMRGVSFTKDGEEGSGVIAQEIEKIAPELVQTNEQDGYKSVAYGNLVGYLIENAKDQQKQIDELKQEVSSLRSKI